MGKLVRMVIVLVVLVVGVLLVMQYSGGSKKPITANNKPAAKSEKAEQDKPQVQEKYGIAPTGASVSP